MTGIAEFAAVTIDCPEPPALAAFYAALTGGEVTYDTAEAAAVKLPGGPDVYFQGVAGHRAPTWPEGSGPSSSTSTSTSTTWTRPRPGSPNSAAPRWGSSPAGAAGGSWPTRPGTRSACACGRASRRGGRPLPGASGPRCEDGGRDGRQRRRPRRAGGRGRQPKPGTQTVDRSVAVLRSFEAPPGRPPPRSRTGSGCRSAPRTASCTPCTPPGCWRRTRRPSGTSSAPPPRSSAAWRWSGWAPRCCGPS